MPCNNRHIIRSAAFLFVGGLLSGPALADPDTVTGDPNHRTFGKTVSVSAGIAPGSQNSRRLGITPTVDGSGVTGMDFAIREITEHGFTDVTLLGQQGRNFAALDGQGREMVIRYDPYRSMITEIVPRREIRARRMAGN